MKHNDNTCSTRQRHCFPSLDEGCDSTVSQSGARASFQPLYSCASTDMQNADDIDEASDPEICLADRLAQARCEGYEQGAQDGREQAGREAVDSFVPDLSSLIDSIDAVAGYNEKLVKAVSDHALRMAVAIAEQILGVRATLDQSRLRSLEELLQKNLSDAYRLNLEFPDQSLAVIKDLLAASDKKWPHHAAVVVAPRAHTADDDAAARSETDYLDLCQKNACDHLADVLSD